MVGGLGAGPALLAAAVFSVLAGLGVAVPVLAMLLAGDEARDSLAAYGTGWCATRRSRWRWCCC
jgi:hypothetical protein